MSIIIDQLTHDELMALNHHIVERLKFLGSMQAHQDMMAFNLGACVSFDSGGAEGHLLGTLLKFNRKKELESRIAKMWPTRMLCKVSKSIRSMGASPSVAVTLSVTISLLIRVFGAFVMGSVLRRLPDWRISPAPNIEDGTATPPDRI